MKRPNITIRYGASNNDVTVDGHRFDLGKLRKDRRAFSFAKNVIIDTLVKVGTVRRRVAA